MTSETICMSTQKCKEFPEQKPLHNEIDQVGCQSSFSCSSEHHRISACRGTNGALSSSESRLGQSLEANNNGSCSARPIQSDIISESRADKCIPNLRNVVNADDNACLHGEHESCEACKVTVLQGHTRHQKGSTLQELYFQEYYDDDDDDDSDWEPVNHFVIQKWFCTNCTMPNFDDVNCCDVCGEYKESDLIRHDLFQSSIGKETQPSISSDAVQKFQDSLSKACTSIGFDERMLLHSEVEMKSHPHPERPDRLRAIVTSLANAGIFPGKCFLIPPREITQEELQMVHSLDHIEAVQQTSHMLCRFDVFTSSLVNMLEDGFNCDDFLDSTDSYFTSDTYANEHSACAARLAAGLCADLARSIMSGHTKNGFALVRPPGHHAGIKQAMGFCLHNNAAIAALAAQNVGAKKVLIVDWDVHHGNGTQEIFDGNTSVLYISLHRHEDGRFYPGTGAADEVGSLDAKGYSVNIPWSCGGVGDNDYIFAFQHIVLPIALEFAPDITIISAGFDAARGDPLGCCDVTPAGYAQMAYMLTAVSQGKLLVILEGGYNLRSISSSATAVVKVLLGEGSSNETSDIIPSRAGLLTVMEVLKIQLRFWPILKEQYTMLQSQWESFSSPSRRNQKKRRRLVGPVWWKWGSKRFMYEIFYGKRQRQAKQIC